MSKYFGTDYYPEHWPRERWETDARLMREMGIGVARMAEFAWSRLETEAGAYDFGWLDEAVELLARQGIRSVLGTPTAAPPAWLIERYPEVLPMDALGIRQSFGGRHHCCHANADYRERILLLVEAMAKHYADNPNVFCWQIDNELGNSHDNLCHCPSCRAAFHRWLERKYGGIESLNDAWGTAFWSQTYQDFAQIPTPRVNVTAHNPSLLLDWRRFCSDLIVGFQRHQADILRRYCPGHLITHNFMGFADKVDYFDLAKDLDFVSHDQYPLFQEDGATFRNMGNLSAALDLIRATKKKPFWIMEQQAGPAGWSCFGDTPAPGQLRLWTAHSISHGADCVVWFRWRSCTVGTEQYWHGILPHSGVPGRRYDELKGAVGALTPVMEKIEGAGSGAEAAILYSYDANSALKIQPCHPKLEYREQVRAYYGGLYRQNVPTDFVGVEDDFSGYKLLIAPVLYLAAPGLCEKLRAYAEAGGCLVLTMRSGVKDETNKMLLSEGLHGLAGLRVDDYTALHRGTAPFAWEDGGEDGGSLWCDVITPDGCKALARYTGGYFAGAPAVTVHTVGRGKVFYVGTCLGEAGMDKLAGLLLGQSGVKSLGYSEPGVEIAARAGENGKFLFVMNHNDAEAGFTAPGHWQPILATEGNRMRPYEVRVYQE